eukprot:g3229.t1
MEDYWSKLKKKSLQLMTMERMVARTQGPVRLRSVIKLYALTMLGIGSIVGAGVFVLTGEVARNHTGPSVILSYAISGFAALFCALCYAEFAADVPCSGAAYNYVALIYGEFLSWMAASDLLLEYMLSASAVAKGFSGYLCTLLGLDSDTLIYTFDDTDYIVIDVVGAVLVMFLTALCAYGVHESFQFNSVSTLVTLLLVVFTICAAAPKVHSGNWSPFFPDKFGLSDTVRGASIVFFAYIGFDSIATVAEEVENPGRDLPVAITISVLVSAVLYMFMAGAIVGMVPYENIDIRAPFSSAFKDVDMDWASRIVSLGALLGILTTTFASCYGGYRLLMVFGRDGFLPNWLAKIHPRTATPIHATIFGGFIITMMALFLDISTLSSMVSAGTLFIFNLVCQACIWRRYRGMSHVPPPADLEPADARWLAVRMALLVLVSIFEGLAVDKEWPLRVWITMAVLIVAIIISYIPLPVIYKCQTFVLPLQPLIPCLGVVFSMHLIVSLEKAAFIRFVVWQATACLIYLFYGVHHTENIQENSGEEVEEDDETNERTEPLIEKHTTSA